MAKSTPTPTAAPTAAPTPEPTAAPTAAPTPPLPDVHCAQRGCVVPRANANDEFCPVCNNPLRLIEDSQEDPLQ